jgi:uncharacterized protein (TIGR03067 family)
MRGVVFLVATAGLLATATVLSGGEKKGDQERLQGTWRAVSAEQRGKDDPNAGQHTLTFTGGKFTIKRSDKLMAEGTFKLDSSKTPKTIDMTITKMESANDEKYKGKTAQGIYELTKGQLKWCSAEPGSGQRPKEFATAGTTHMCVTPEREKK